MNACISGIGWITPLGADLDTVWQRLASGDAPQPQLLTNPETGRVHTYLPVPPKLVEHLARHPRMRRSSAISFFAVAAGLAALENAGLPADAARDGRTAVVVAVSDGASFTRAATTKDRPARRERCESLFFETVYTARRSICRDAGDRWRDYARRRQFRGARCASLCGAVPRARRCGCVLVGAEEIDWVLCSISRLAARAHAGRRRRHSCSIARVGGNCPHLARLFGSATVCLARRACEMGGGLAPS